MIVFVLGLAAELLLLEHYEKNWQIIPIALLGLGIVSLIAAFVRPTDLTIRALRIVMLFFVIAAPLGIWLHYSGNVEWELERRPDAGGTWLIWKSLRGATPVLAPGAMAQLGLLGLLYTFRHPALRRRGSEPSSQERT